MNWPLYLDEEDMARFVMGARAKNWPAVRALDEKKGLPPIDPVHGGRFRPDVEAFYADLNKRQAGRPVIITRLRPDGEEHPNAETPATIHRERRPRGDRRARA